MRKRKTSKYFVDYLLPFDNSNFYLDFKCEKKITHLQRSRNIRGSSGASNGLSCIENSVVIRALLLLLLLLFFVDVEFAVNGATIDETASKPRDNFNISAPNWCNAVIVDGVGSGILIGLCESEKKTLNIYKWIYNIKIYI